MSPLLPKQRNRGSQRPDPIGRRRVKRRRRILSGNTKRGSTATQRRHAGTQRRHAGTQRRHAAPLRVHGTALLAAATLLSLLACAEPDLPEGEQEGPEDAAPAEDILDPATDQLIIEVAGLRASVEDAAIALSEVQTATDLDTVRDSGRRAVAALVDDAGLAPGVEPGTRPLLPSQSTDRGGGDDDAVALFAVATAARNASGPLAEQVTDLLRDPIAGDLGAWSRDAQGMLGLVLEAVTSTDDLAGLEIAVLELPGEATRALAWSLVAAEAADLQRATDAAERGLFHLELILAAIDDLGESNELNETDESDETNEPSDEP